MERSVIRERWTSLNAVPDYAALHPGYLLLVAAMRERGFSSKLIEKVCFRNWLRVLKKTWG
jgi:membrane dipeptidase